ncbi:MAG: lipoyl(octanoyl) transferase LipB [Proteobacteria bacterium]|nr:lipoyl(octanoyl) transferase LipB [Pseudomonadota bacterium]
MNDLTWKTSRTLQGYPAAVAAMEERVGQIYAGTAPELVWLLEHPALYTAGTSASSTGLKEARFPVYQTGRGGEYTYHGPGQRVGYVMLDLRDRGQDVRKHVWRLEEWMIQTLGAFGVAGERRSGRIGVWVARPDGREQKIAAIGVRVRKWITYHGISINVNPNLEHYSGIVPCGIEEFGVTSLHDLGVKASLEEVDKVLKKTFEEIF